MPSQIIGRPVDAQIWHAIKAEFALPSLQDVRSRFADLMEDPEPVMQQLVRVFIGDGTFCPGFQFLDRGQLHPIVTALFRHALELRIPHNYFAVWMITPSKNLSGKRPVDSLGTPRQLHDALAKFAHQIPGHRPK